MSPFTGPGAGTDSDAGTGVGTDADTEETVRLDRARTDRATEQDERLARVARRRFARRQRARRWLVWRPAVVVAVLLAVVAGATWLVFFSSVLAVKGVDVAGTGSLDPRTVRSAAAVPTGTPLATVDLDAVRARVAALPAVRSVDVTRSWPDRVRVQVVERQAVAVVDRAGVLRGVDRDGVLFRRYPSRPTSLPLVRTGAHTPRDALAEGARVAASLPGDLAARVRSVHVRTVDEIALDLRNGKRVLWGSAQNSEAKARVLTVLLHHRARLYDVTVPGRPVITR